MSGQGSHSSTSIEDFRTVTGPIIDVRTPKEYDQGHWPGSINVPLFSNEERAIIGKIYKREGKKQAILLGLKFIMPRSIWKSHIFLMIKYQYPF